MKLIASGVANCAAIVRSPSFSRSAASTTTTNFPSRMSSIASSIGANAFAHSTLSIAGSYPSAGREPFDVLREDVDLEVHAVAGPECGQRGLGEGVRD